MFSKICNYIQSGPWSIMGNAVQKFQQDLGEREYRNFNTAISILTAILVYTAVDTAREPVTDFIRVHQSLTFNIAVHLPDARSFLLRY